MSITSFPINPNKCVLVFGIPTSKESFFNDQFNENKDFAKKFGGVWTKYYYQFVKELEIIKPLFFKTGLKVKHELKLNEFNQLFKSNTVVILFSHWNQDKIEFSDGLKSIPEVVNEIPDNFEGLIDLCVESVN